MWGLPTRMSGRLTDAAGAYRAFAEKGLFYRGLPTYPS